MLLSRLFQHLDYIWMRASVFILLYVCWDFWMCRLIFKIKFGQFLDISLNTFSVPLSFLPLFWLSHTNVLECLILPYWCLRLYSFFFNYYVLISSGWLFCTYLSSSSWSSVVFLLVSCFLTFHLQNFHFTIKITLRFNDSLLSCFPLTFINIVLWIYL